MTPTGSTKFIERVRFFENERLTAPDLQAMDDYARQMRCLHNRSLHQPGVASGYAIAGEKGDRQVTIQPGYAIDALGREIVLTQPYTQPVPPQAGDGQGGPAIFDLTVAYPDTLPESESRTADCASAVPGSVRLDESPVFCWVGTTPADKKLRDQLDTGMRIALGRAQVLNCQLYDRISVAQRRDARPGVHPIVYAAIADSIGWVVSQGAFGIELAPLKSPTLGAPAVPVPIDTSAAGFRTPPGYFASLADEAILPGTSTRLDVLVSIANPTNTGFEVSLLIPTVLLLVAGLDPATVIHGLGTPTWRIEWMGVEA
jgi:hypothetical protein